MCLTARFINADEALQWGLVSEVTTPENLLTRANEILTGLIALAPLALAGVMKVIDTGYDLTLDDALHLEAIHFSLLCATKDKTEGTNAFLQKRAANFKGK